MKKPYVAIVDDDSAFANYLRTFLSLRGYETRSYSRGDEMLASVKHGDPPDVVGRTHARRIGIAGHEEEDGDDYDPTIYYDETIPDVVRKERKPHGSRKLIEGRCWRSQGDGLSGRVQRSVERLGPLRSRR